MSTENFTFAVVGYAYSGEGKDDNDLGSLLIMNAGLGLNFEVDTLIFIELKNNSVLNYKMSLKYTLKSDSNILQQNTFPSIIKQDKIYNYLNFNIETQKVA